MPSETQQKKISVLLAELEQSLFFTQQAQRVVVNALYAEIDRLHREYSGELDKPHERITELGEFAHRLAATDTQGFFFTVRSIRARGLEIERAAEVIEKLRASETSQAAADEVAHG